MFQLTKTTTTQLKLTIIIELVITIVKPHQVIIVLTYKYDGFQAKIYQNKTQTRRRRRAKVLLPLLPTMKINQAALVVLCLALTSSSVGVFGGNLFDDLICTWGNGRSKIVNNGQLLSVMLDKVSGSGFESKTKYLFARFDMFIKLVAGNSAGTVTACFVSTF